MGERKAFKEYLDRAAAKQLAGQLATAYPKLDKAMFVRVATRGIATLEFIDRVKQFAAAARETLPRDYEKALSVILKSLPPGLEDTEELMTDWYVWPLCQFVQEYGVDHFEPSMDAMYELTQRFSCEFAVRPFLIRYPRKTLARLTQWTRDPNPHVRRLCSEGTRPRLPWGQQLRDFVQDPTPALSILEALKDDPELFVRRSVANHLNDIAKDHPEVVIKVCKSWKVGATEERRWVIKHALRTLIKNGNRSALTLVGVGKPELTVGAFAVDRKQVPIGENVGLRATLASTARKPQSLVVDYVVHLQRVGGKTNAKVFKWKTFTLGAGETIELTKKHSFKPITTRKYYPGVHRMELQINGTRLAECSLTLLNRIEPIS